jgi:hypothetical protein
MRISKQPHRLMALPAVLAAVTLAFGFEAGAAPAEKGPVAKAAGAKRFCKRHPRKARCRRLRLTVSWDDNANIDLFVWDSSLRQASPFTRFAIPKTFHSGDTGVLPEKFFDRRFTPKRHFAFGVCLAAEPFADPSVFTVTYKRPDGTTFTDTDELFDRGQSILYLEDGVPDPDPSNSGAWCQA